MNNISLYISGTESSILVNQILHTGLSGPVFHTFKLFILPLKTILVY
jgi:hypothetical protein